MSFDGAMAKFGLKEVKDLPTLGRIVEDCFIGVPALYITRRNTATEHVGHVQWCANPAYGPADCTYCRHDYYRQEVYLTYVYIWELIEKAKKAGLKEEILVDLPSGRCRDGAACACQIILRTRAANPDLPLPEVERKFIDLEMGDQEPVAYILKNRSAPSRSRARARSWVFRGRFSCMAAAVPEREAEGKGHLSEAVADLPQDVGERCKA